MDDITHLRNCIQKKDMQLLDILEQRHELVLQLWRLKREQGIECKDAVQEQEVIKRLCEKSQLDHAFIEELYKLIFKYN